MRWWPISIRCNRCRRGRVTGATCDEADAAARRAGWIGHYCPRCLSIPLLLVMLRLAA